MHVTSMTIAVTTSSRVPIKLPTMMAMSMLLSSDSAAVVSVVVPSGEKQDYNVSFFNLLLTPTATSSLVSNHHIILLLQHICIWTANISSLMMIRDIMNKTAVRAMKE